MTDPFNVDPAEVRRVMAKLNGLGREPSRSVQVEVRKRRPFAPPIPRKVTGHIEVQPFVPDGEPDDVFWTLTLVDGPHSSKVGDFDDRGTLGLEIDRCKKAGHAIQWMPARSAGDWAGE